VSLERDIDVVLVTGAEASRAFGVNGKPMPLMDDWPDHLVRKLGQRIGYREVIGLKSGMSGPFSRHRGRGRAVRRSARERTGQWLIPRR
jgi:hypothetical protein